jgi:hypothetical protein
MTAPQASSAASTAVAASTATAAPPFAATHGSLFDSSDPEILKAALDEAFSYRGDVTIVTRDGRSVEGYMFDRRLGHSLADSSVRLLTAASETRITISYADIASLAFTGRDTAAGKTWENWVRRYSQKKLAGQSANIESDSLD